MEVDVPYYDFAEIKARIKIEDVVPLLSLTMSNSFEAKQ